ncbi:MAG: hypothetical protein Q9164_006085 [Protoblastenia rupestris]
MASPQTIRNLHPDVNPFSGTFIPEFIRLTPPPNISTASDYDGQPTQKVLDLPSQQKPPLAPANNFPIVNHPIKMKLVDAHAVRNLLTDNVDENVSHYVVFTDHGTLLSHDHNIPKTALTKFAPFAGTVWRNHNASITSTGSTSLSVGGLPAMKTLKTDLRPDELGLRSLTVEMDGVVSVMRLIIPRLLVAAQLESASFREEEEDEVSARIAGLAINEGCREEGSESVNDGEANGDGESANGEAEDGDDAASRDGNDGKKKLGKMRILELKVEGMAEFLADEYPAKLPHDFY